MFTFHGADDTAELPNLTPEESIVLDTPAVELVVILQVDIVLLVDQQPQLGQLVMLKERKNVYKKESISHR